MLKGKVEAAAPKLGAEVAEPKLIPCPAGAEELPPDPGADPGAPKATGPYDVTSNPPPAAKEPRAAAAPPPEPAAAEAAAIGPVTEGPPEAAASGSVAFPCMTNKRTAQWLSLKARNKTMHNVRLLMKPHATC